MSRLDGVVSRWWDVAVLGTCAATAALVFLADGDTWTSWAATAALAGTALVYVTLGRRALASPDASVLRWWATGLFIATACLAAYFDTTGEFVQAILCPLMWGLSSGTRSAVIRTAVLAGGEGLAAGLGTGTWLTPSIGAVLAFVFSVALGLWITRIVAYGTERDRLLTQLRATQAVVASLERQAGITEERARVAREIHDTIAQSLTGLVMTAQRASSKAARAPGSVGPELAAMEHLAQEALAEARTLVASYTPVTVSGGLPATLAAIAERFSAETGVAVSVSGEAPAVSREGEVVLLRCAQEALANVRKHARARQVRIRLDDAGVTISDDGIGMGEAASDGYGLAGMAERVRLVGGTVEVGSAEPSGTTVRVVLPGRTGAEAAS